MIVIIGGLKLKCLVPQRRLDTKFRLPVEFYESDFALGVVRNDLSERPNRLKQGHAANSVFYINKGKVKLTVRFKAWGRKPW